MNEEVNKKRFTNHETQEARVSGKKTVIFSIDTESNVGHPYRISGDLTEYGFEDNWGVRYIMDEFEKRDMRAVFFVNVYEQVTYKPEYGTYISDLCAEIEARGHEVALHSHQNGTHSIYRHAIDSYNLDVQTEIIRCGCDFIKEATGKAPVSFRGGAYIIDENTLLALEQNGIKIDSSCFHSQSKRQRLKSHHSINQFHRIGNLMEFPVLSVDNGGTLSKLDINWLSFARMKAVIEQIKQTANFPYIGIMFHSFSFLDERGETGADPLFSCRDRMCYGGLPEIKARFEQLLDYISADPQLEVATYRDCLETGFELPDMAADRLFRLEKEVKPVFAGELSAAQNGRCFTFAHQPPDGESFLYSWGVCGENEEERFGTTFGEDSQFTYEAVCGETVLLRLRMRNTTTGKTTGAFVVKISTAEDICTMQELHPLCRLGEEVVRMPVTPLTLRYPSSAISYSQENGVFAFRNNRWEENTEYAFFLLDEQDQVLERTQLSASPDATFDLTSYTGRIKLKAAAKYCGNLASRIAAEILCDGENGRYELDPHYNNPETKGLLSAVATTNYDGDFLIPCAKMEDWRQNIFYIDSENLNDVTTQLYGYCVSERWIADWSNFRSIPNFQPSGEGAYNYVVRNGNSITVEQDCFGSQGLFLFRDESFFALSNSLLHLIERVKEKHVLTLNRDLAFHNVQELGALRSGGDTIVNEITLLEKNATVKISVDTATLSLSYSDFQEMSVALDSEEGMDILDRWHKKWTRINKAVGMSGLLEADLTGGFDSRMADVALFNSDVDFDKVRINSDKANANSSNATKEDYQIASDIANHLHIQLNTSNDGGRSRTPLSYQDTVAISCYAKLFQHNTFSYRAFAFHERSYNTIGAGGESLRGGAYEYTPQKAVMLPADGCKKVFSKSLMEEAQAAIKRLVRSMFEKMDGPNPDMNSLDLTKMYYRDWRSRCHFGRGMMEGYMHNLLRLAPLVDPELQRLKPYTEKCKDWNLLCALIFTRFSKDLLDFPFEGNRSIKPETIQAAAEINEAFPKKSWRDTAPLSICVQGRDEAMSRKGVKSQKFVSMEKIRENMLKLVSTNYIRDAFCKCFDEETYNNLVCSASNEAKFSLNRAHAVLGIALAMHYVEDSGKGNRRTLMDLLQDNFPEQ